MPRHRFGSLRSGKPRSNARALQGDFSVASARITAELDAGRVLQAAVEEVHRTLGFPWTSIWVTNGGEPRLAASAGALQHQVDGPVGVPPAVRGCAATGRPQENMVVGMLAFPIITPLSGLVGVLYLQGRVWNVEEQNFLEAIVRQIGLTLEAANLFATATKEKRTSEAILARIADGVVLTDVAGSIVQFNEAARRIVEPDGDPIGRTCAEVLGLYDGERALDCSAGCALLALRDGSLAGVELWRARADGRRQLLLAEVAPVTEADGTVTSLVHSLRDITKLKQADEAKTLFLATASHELKTPLTVIGGFAETLLERGDKMDPEARLEAMRAIERRSRQLSGIVNRLLLSSRIEAGRVDVRTAPTDVVPLLRERAESWQASTARDVRLEAYEPSAVALADPAAVGTIADHLIENAIKYSPDGGAIEMSVQGSPERISIAVRDRGIGMDAEAIAHCAEKFWQAESTDVRRFGGTGIGLYIVRSLAEAMGGSLDIASVVGAGSTFTVRLPTALDAGQPERTSEPAAQEGEPSVIREFMRQIGIPTGRIG